MNTVKSNLKQFPIKIFAKNIRPIFESESNLPKSVSHQEPSTNIDCVTSPKRALKRSFPIGTEFIIDTTPVTKEIEDPSKVLVKTKQASMKENMKECRVY